MEYNSEKAVDNLHQKQKKFFNAQVTQTTGFRIEKLKALKKEIQKREKDIYDALKKDLSKSGFESMTSEMVLVEKEISKMIRMLPLWNRAHRVKSSLINFPSKDYILPEPYGNTLIISPWNYPFQLAITPLVGAVAAGNTVVLKPSELAPLSSMILAEIIDEVKFPKGVFNLVNGDGATTGDALTSHPDINMISFTGSTRAGALISQNAAKDFKRVSLELGGKGANIIFKDADPEAIERGALRCFRNSGQSCNAPTRMLVEKSMYDEAVERVNQKLPIIDKNYNKHLGWEFQFTMKQNEMFVFPNGEQGFEPTEIDLFDKKNQKEISFNLFRIQKIGEKDYWFRHHLETTITNNLEFTYKRLRNPNALAGVIKVRINHIGNIVHVGEY